MSIRYHSYLSVREKENFKIQYLRYPSQYYYVLMIICYVKTMNEHGMWLPQQS